VVITGPSVGALGQRTANVDGIRIDGRYRLDNLIVQNFDSGIVFNCSDGHITLSNVTVGSCYYGIYFLADNGDNFIVDCNINGNNFANCAAPAVTAGTGSAVIEALVTLRSHCGFAPYGFYQEAGANAQPWLDECTFIDTRFESIGNGAFFTENSSGAGGAGQVSSLILQQPGFSWNASHRIGTRPWDYAMVVGYARDRNRIYDTSSSCLQDGNVGTLYVGDNQATWDWVYRNVPTITVDSGSSSGFNMTSTDGTVLRGEAAIPAGETTTTVSCSYVGPYIWPSLTPLSNGGLGAFTLMVTAPWSSSPSGTSFTVTVSGGTPTSLLIFLWVMQ
jgi:hypothetical protein